MVKIASLRCPRAPRAPSRPQVRMQRTAICMREYALVCSKFPVLIPVFFAPIGETSVTDRNFSLSSDSSFFCRLSDSSFSGSYKSPKPVWKGPKRTFFCHVKWSLIHSAPALDDGCTSGDNISVYCNSQVFVQQTGYFEINRLPLDVGLSGCVGPH